MLSRVCDNTKFKRINSEQNTKSSQIEEQISDPKEIDILRIDLEVSSSDEDCLDIPINIEWEPDEPKSREETRQKKFEQLKREAQEQRRQQAPSNEEINHKLFGPPIPLEKKNVSEATIEVLNKLPEQFKKCFGPDDEFLEVKPEKEKSNWPLQIVGFNPQHPPPVRKAPLFIIGFDEKVKPPAIKSLNHKAKSKVQAYWRKLEKLALNKVRERIGRSIKLMLDMHSFSKKKKMMNEQ